jgi:hypothetical protein
MFIMLTTEKKLRRIRDNMRKNKILENKKKSIRITTYLSSQMELKMEILKIQNKKNRN